MILKLFTTVFFHNICLKAVTSLFLFLFLVSGATNALAENKSYLRLEQSKDSELNDYKITSIGALMFQDDAETHFDLQHLKSDLLGNSLALGFGGGYVFNGDLSVFLGVGISLDYNFDSDEFNDKYYAEAGIVIDIARTVSITARMQHFFHQPYEYEEVVMLGLMFRH